MKLSLHGFAAAGTLGALCAGALVSVVMAGCKNHDYYGNANVSDQAGDPLAILDMNAGIWIPEGSVASAHVDLVGFDGTAYQGNIVSMDPSVLQILHTPGDNGKYVFLATFNGVPVPGEANSGSAEVVISVNGVPVRSIVATVEGPTLAEDAGAGADADAGSSESEAGTSDAGDAGDAEGEPLESDAGDGGDAT